jgi:general secretion pathway protein A
VLEELRLLTNIETTRDKLLQVILIGQPELADLMERPALRQLAQRITARYQLRPFTSSETRAYVEHRLRVAGQRQSIFTASALRVIHRRSGGVPRLINNICDRALLGAFGRSKRQVNAAMVRIAAAEVSGTRRWTRWLQPVAAALLVAAVGVTAGMLGRSRLEYVAAWWGQRLVPADVPSSNAAVVATPPTPVPAVVTAPARPNVASILGATTADRNAALATLFERWSVQFTPRPGESACDVAHRAGLRCLIRSASWNVVRRLDVPVMLTLTTPTGDRHYATATALADDTVTVEVVRHPITLALNDVDRFWDGAFVALWRSPDLGATDLKPGDDLKRRVVAFQRAHGLLADGVLGEDTLLQLAARMPGPRPSLSRSTP